MRANLSCFPANVFRKALPCVLVASMSVVLAGCSSGSSTGSTLADSESSDGLTEPEDSNFEPSDELTEPEDSNFEPSDEITEAEVGNITEQLLGDLEFGTLLAGLQRAGLQEALETDNDGLGWTLFAPVDTMFEMDPDFQDLPTIMAQTEIIRGHVASGTFLFSDLVPGNTIIMQDGNEALIELAPDGASLVVGGAIIGTEGLRVTNGVIHRVDSLITTR